MFFQSRLVNLFLSCFFVGYFLTVPLASHYLSWRQALFAQHLWPYSAANTYTLALAGLAHLLYQVDERHIEFESNHSGDRHHLRIQLPVFVPPTLNLNLTFSAEEQKWVDRLDELLAQISLLSAEQALFILTHLLINSWHHRSECFNQLSLEGLAIHLKTTRTNRNPL